MLPSRKGTRVASATLPNISQGAASGPDGAGGGAIRAWPRLAASLAAGALYALRPAAVACVTLGDRVAVARSGVRTHRALARTLARILSLRIEAAGSLPDGPCVVCANHLSSLDIPVLASLTGGLFVSRADVAGWPFVGLLVRLGGTVFLDRSRRSDVVRAAAEVGGWLDRGFRVVLFPEGRATDGSAVLPFRPSILEAAARRGTPCVAATLVYSLPDDPGATVARDVSWAGDDSFASHALRFLRLRRIAARVTFHPPRTGADRKALAAALEADCRSGLPPAPTGDAAGRTPGP